MFDIRIFPAGPNWSNVQATLLHDAPIDVS
jgi:hypothetical protein